MELSREKKVPLLPEAYGGADSTFNFLHGTARERELRKMRVRYFILRAVLSLVLAFLTIALLQQLYLNHLSDVRFGALPDFARHRRPTKIHNTTDFNTPLFRPPFRTVGRYILDQDGNRVKLRSVNWYGASDIFMVPSGLDIRHRSEIAALIRAMGFNSVRLPFADELVIENPVIDGNLLNANPDLIGSRALDVFFAVIEALTDAGIAVIPNNHITQAEWCCGTHVDDMCDAGWSNDFLGSLCRVSQSKEDWLQHWETIMSPFANNSLVIGADLRNEVRGVLGSMPWSRWAPAAEEAGERLLKLNPNWLIFVEGIASANDLSGVHKQPITLSIPSRVVYSAHVYSWSGWGIGWPYSKRPYSAFKKSMRRNWAWLLEEDIAPVWVGEFGAPVSPSPGDYNYWSHLIRYLKELDADWGYWAINPRKPQGNEWESYGLVKDDWETVLFDYRLGDLMKLGLDYER
jgi:endoglucanase